MQYYSEMNLLPDIKYTCFEHKIKLDIRKNSNMKIIIAPDSFKGNMRSTVAAEIIKRGILSLIPDAEILLFPMADGGEGTVEAMIAATGGTLHQVKVLDPLGKNIEAEYGILGNSGAAVMEMASASGIELLKSEELNPWRTSTYGTGEILRVIIESGVREIIIGIGGSATTDGGSGMAQALGYRFFDHDGKEIPPGCNGGRLADIAAIDTSKVIPQLQQVNIKVACDVTNPLLGKNGAAHVYGPQKGADPDMVLKLDAGLDNFASVLVRSGFAADCEQPGDGAAGGLGFGLRTLCNATMTSGAQLIIDASGMRDHLAGASLVITGEGRTDSQTASGKICAVIAQTAKEYDVPTIVLSGAVKGRTENMQKIFAAAFSIDKDVNTLEEAILHSRDNLYDAARNLAGVIRYVK